ncbi:MAG TPA: methyltransferase domain-containing protein [Ktedonobacteraceae bacterium]|nr:methyltransferase domain-containing protein [Ktedonobacteraceae bacterium]
MNIRFLRNGLLLAIGSTSGALFSILVGSKVFYRIASHQGKQGPALAHGGGWIRESSGRLRKIPLMLDWMRLRAGERVLELGAGTGQFTILAARRLGHKGRLYAFDIQPEMIARVQQKVNAAQLTNVHTQVAAAYELPLDDCSIDKAMLVNVLPEIPDHQRALHEVARVLQPHGTLYISEEFSEPGYWFISETIRRVEQTGQFVLSTQRGNWWRYTLGFRKRIHA